MQNVSVDIKENTKKSVRTVVRKWKNKKAFMYLNVRIIDGDIIKKYLKFRCCDKEAFVHGNTVECGKCGHRMEIEEEDTTVSEDFYNEFMEDPTNRFSIFISIIFDKLGIDAEEVKKLGMELVHEHFKDDMVNRLLVK